MKDEVVAAVPKGPRSAVWLRLTVQGGRNVIDMRLYCEKGGAMKPTKSGIRLDLNRLPLLYQALGKVVERARALGLLDSSAGADE